MISVEICFITISILCHTVQFLPALFGRSESFSCKTKRRSAWLCGQVMPPVPLVLVTSYPLRPARRAMLEYMDFTSSSLILLVIIDCIRATNSLWQCIGLLLSSLPNSPTNMTTSAALCIRCHEYTWQLASTSAGTCESIG